MFESEHFLWETQGHLDPVVDVEIDNAVFGDTAQKEHLALTIRFPTHSSKTILRCRASWHLCSIRA